MLDILVPIIPLANALEQLGVIHYIGGSVASSAYGLPRTTIDADVIAYLRVEHVQPLVKMLEDQYYIDADMIRDAIRHRSEFNIIHYATNLKVDVFMPKTRPYDEEVRHRMQQQALDEADNNHLFYLESPEDVILTKLEWYNMSGGVSDRQWGDILGVLKVQGKALDFAYLHHWAQELGVTEQFTRALEDAGLDM